MVNQKTNPQLEGQINGLKKDLQDADNVLASEKTARGRSVERPGNTLNKSKVEKNKYPEREDYYQIILESISDVAYTVAPDGTIIYVSPQIKQNGYSLEEIISKNFMEFVKTDQRQEVIRKFESGMASGESFPTQFQFINQDGSHTWVEAVGKTVVDESGNPLQQVGILRNISFQKELEQKLHRSEEKYRSLVEQINEVIYSIDLDGVITYINPAIESFLAYKPSEIIGRPFYQFIASDDLHRVNDNFHRLSEGTIPEIQEYKALTKSGEIRWMQTSSKPVIKGDQVVGVQGVLTDITDRKLFEEQIEQIAAAAERERLARELHDSVTQALFTTCLIADTLPRVWDRDQGQAQKGLELIRRLSNGALAEMRALLLELRPDTLEEQDLDILLRQLADGLRARTQITITTTIMGDCKLPREVRIGLYRIAQEALNNIIKHSGASIAKIRLNCTQEGVTLSVIDNGRGFDPDTTPPGHFGLKIMHERSLAIDANIRINSRFGQGTEVVVQWEEKGSPL